MKNLKLLSILVLLLSFFSCSTVKVSTDYDTTVNFDNYKTFAFYKPGIDKAKISDLDKKRILRAIESELLSLGFSKSVNPDVLVSLFTKSRTNVDVNQNNLGFGWGWNPWMFGGNNNISINQYSEGTLFIDILDRENKELIWQGKGTAVLKGENPKDREERINLIVKEIISRFPPDKK